MLAYGIGRLGCQFAGDGDWGIYNSAYVTTAQGTLQAVSPVQGASNVAFYHSNYRFDTSHKYAPAPAWAPVWLWAQNYPRNVGNEGIRLKDCPHPDYCGVLPIAVFPTPIYEAIVCIALFFFLWGIRHRLKGPWQMFGIYLILNGIERFLVEQIRVNYQYDWGFIHPTQAEIIAVGLILSGAALLLYSKRKVPAAVPEGA
jgi:prolipoprotein diacylglyceryltransferase